MATSRKKMIARMYTRAWLAGYVSNETFAEMDPAAGQVEILSLDGKLVKIEHELLKWICLVRDFNSGEVENPERLLRKTFSGRPRGAGLWLRMTLKDGDAIEGLAENDASLIAGPGIFMTPPDIRSNTQRIWLPRNSVSALEVAAVLGGNLRRSAETGRRTSATPAQETLFPEGRSLSGKIQSSL